MSKKIVCICKKSKSRRKFIEKKKVGAWLVLYFHNICINCKKLKSDLVIGKEVY